MSADLPRLLLLEDDAALAPIMVEYLAEDYLVTHVADGRTGLAAGLDGDFDVMVVDRRMPGLEGVEVVKELRRAHVLTPVILLTALGTVRDRVEGLDAGANDYLVKPFEFEELLARLRAIRRTHRTTDGALEIGGWSFHPDDRIIRSPYLGPLALSPRETALLRLLALEPERTFSRAQILRAAFAPGDQPSVVDTYVHYLRRKTEDSVVVTVRGVGYRLGRL